MIKFRSYVAFGVLLALAACTTAPPPAPRIATPKFSRKYDTAPMPWIQNIDDKGIALHGGNTPGYAASHGCIRLPMAFAKQLYTLTKPGNKVVIEG